MKNLPHSFKTGFTIPELLVVMTITAVLATIGFLSFLNYNKEARDTARTTDIKNISRILDLYSTTRTRYPDPTDLVDITYSGAVVWSQGVFGKDTAEQTGKIFGELRDPKYGSQYTYSVSGNRREYQLAAVFEDEINATNLFTKNIDIPSFGAQAYAAVDFSPLELSPAIWLDGLDIDGDGDETDNPSNGGTISQWVNKSSAGAANNPIRTGGDLQYATTGLTGQFPGVYVDDDVALTLQNSDITQGDIFFVIDNNDPFNNTDANGRGLQSTTGNFLIGHWGEYRDALYINGSPSHFSSSPATRNGRTWTYVYGFHTDNTNYGFYRNGNLISQGATRSITGREWGFNQAGNSSNQSAEFVVSEVLIFDSKLSTTDRQKVEGYLTHRWGKANLLSNSHPYKQNPPEGSVPPTPDSEPDNFVLTDVSNANISTLYNSNSITVSGINTSAPISITGGEYSINSTTSYTSSPGNVSLGDIIRVRQTSSLDSSTSTIAGLNIGGVSENYIVTTLTIDDTPDTITFNAVQDADVSTEYISQSITISGLNTSVPISISGPGAEYKITDGVPHDATGAGVASASSTYSLSSPQGAFDNDTADGGWGNNNSQPSWLKYDFGAGNKQKITSYTLYRDHDQDGWQNTDNFSPSNWTFQGSNDDSDWSTLDTRTNQTIFYEATKKQFSFTNSSFYRYYRINISSSYQGLYNWTNITEMEMINEEGAGVFTASTASVSNGDVVLVKVPSSGNAGTTVTASLAVGSSTSDFVVTTIAPDTLPDSFTFVDEVDANPGIEYISNTVTITGINAQTPISISGGGTYSINGAAYTSGNGTVDSFDTISLKLNAPSGASQTSSTTFTAGGVPATYNISTPAPPPDTTPDSFSFTSISDANLSTEHISNLVIVSGINSATNISISGGEYDINASNSFTASNGTVQNGDTISLKGLSSTGPGNTTTVTLTVGGISQDFLITTVPLDETPNVFTVSDISGAMINTFYESDPIVISGINVPVDISVSQGEYSINGSAFQSGSQSGVINNGDEIRLRLVSFSTWADINTLTLTVGGISEDFIITNGPGDTIPDAFTFNDVNDANLNSQYISDSIVISGLNADTPISITGGEYTIGTIGGYTSEAGTINNGDTLTIRQVSSIVGLTTSSAIVTIGGIVDSYDVNTRDFSVSNDTSPSVSVSNVFVGGDYNGLISYANSGSTHYIIAAPSIITSDISDTDIVSILENKKLVYDGYVNTPGSYTGVIANFTGGLDFSPSSPVLYEGSKEDLGSYGGLKQIDEGIRSTYNNFPAYQNVATHLDDYSLGYLEGIIGQNIGINPIKPFYCSDILRSQLVFNVAPEAVISATPNTIYGGYGTGGIANGVTSTIGDLDYEYHSDTGNGQITFEWEKSQKVGYIRIYNRTGCCSDRLSGASIQLFNQFGGIIYTHTLWDTTDDYVIDLDLEGIGQLYDVSKVVIQAVGGNTLNLREVEIFLGGNVESGIYKVDRDGLGGVSPYNVYCDMETDGGGWTRIGEDYITNGELLNQNHVGEYTFGVQNSPNDNLIVSGSVEAAPSVIPDAFVLQHNGSSAESYEMFFDSIPGEFFAQEIRISAWVKDTNASIFNNTIKYDDGSIVTTASEYEVLDEVEGWQYRMARIPLEGLVDDFTWNAGEGSSGRYYMTGFKMEVYYR